MSTIHSLGGVTPLQQTQGAGRAPSQPGGSAEQAPRWPEDQTSLSAAGTLASRALGVSDVRMEKVIAVQQALAEGSYSVPEDKVAGALLKHMLDR